MEDLIRSVIGRENNPGIRVSWRHAVEEGVALIIIESERETGFERIAAFNKRTWDAFDKTTRYDILEAIRKVCG
jgi:hypothetical protein